MKLNKCMLSFALAVLLLSTHDMDVRAASYSNVIKDVPGTESTATFVFSFSEHQTYEVTLTDPNGDVYNKSAKSGEIRIDVKDAPSGDYTYEVEANKDFTHSVVVTDVGKTIASVGESNPTITENVSDLAIYFVDGDLVATWEYEGNVSITITDPSKFYNLESDYKTSATEYRREIPENIESIQFYIVPTVDTKVPGAGLTYTRAVVRDVDAYVDFPDIPVVNKDVITVPISVQEDSIVLKIYNNEYTLGVSNHNDETLDTVFSGVVSKGDYELEIPLVSLENELVACIIDEQGNAVTSSYRYIRDMQSPKIDPTKISLDNMSQYTGYTTTNNMVLISGTITDEIATDMLGDVERFTIDGYDVPLDNSGRFTFEHQLVMGDNNIVLVATDVSGNQSELTITVTMTEKDKISVGMILFVLFILLLIILIILLLIMLKKKKVDVVNNVVDAEDVEVESESPQQSEQNVLAEDVKKVSIEKRSAMIAKLKADASKQSENKR